MGRTRAPWLAACVAAACGALVGGAAGRAVPGGGAGAGAGAGAGGPAARCEGVPQWMVLDECVALKVGESRTDTASTTKQGGLTVGGNAYSIDAASALDEEHPFFRLELQAIGGLSCKGRLIVQTVGGTGEESSELDFTSAPGDAKPVQHLNLSSAKLPYKQRYTVSVYTPWQDNPDGACTYTIKALPMAVTTLEDGQSTDERAVLGEWRVFSWPSSLAHPWEVALSTGTGAPHGCSLEGTVIGGGTIFGAARWDGILKIWPGGTEPLPLSPIGQIGATWYAAFTFSDDTVAGQAASSPDSGCDYSIHASKLAVTDLRPGVTHTVHVSPDGVSPALFAVPFRGPRLFDTVYFGAVGSGDCNVTVSYSTDGSSGYEVDILSEGQLAPVLIPNPGIFLPDNRFEDDLMSISLGLDGNTGSCSFPVTLTEGQNLTMPAGQETMDVPEGPAGPSLTLVTLDCDQLAGCEDLEFRVTSGECGGAVGVTDDVLPVDWGVKMGRFKVGDTLRWSPPEGNPPLTQHPIVFLDTKTGSCGWTLGKPAGPVGAAPV